MLAGMRTRPWVKKFFYYQIWEGPTDRAGLLYENETPKPAWHAYRAFTAAHPAPETVSVNLSTTDISEGVTLVTVGDGNTTPDVKASRASRRNTNAAGGDYYMYFNVDDDFAFEGNRPVVAIDVDYYDLGTGTLTLQYDSLGDGFYKSAGSVSLSNKDTWKQFTFYIEDAYFGNRQNNGADFRLSAGVGTTFYLDLIRVTAAPIGTQPGDFNFDGTVDAADYAAWRKHAPKIYTEGDFNTWRARFSQATGGGGANAHVPEPAALVLVGLAFLVGSAWSLRISTPVPIILDSAA
jgi:hypothetical protein